MPSAVSEKDAASIFHLPIEILGEIIDLSPRSAQISLSQVSTPLHSLAIRSLYRDLSLTTPSSLVGCCRTLVGKQLAAVSVQNLSIAYIPTKPIDVHYLSSFYHLVSSALRLLTSLHTLKLHVPDPNYANVLSASTFSHLHHFECYLSLTPPLTDFLNRHPSLFYLQVAPHELIPAPLEPSSLPTIASPSQVTQHITLPRLEYFVGSGECVAQIASAASLRAAFIFWDATEQEPAEAIMALERSSTETLNLVSCRRRGWNLDLLDLISTRLPSIYALSLTNLLMVDSHPSQAVLDVIRDYLSRFDRLQSLHIHCIDVWHTSDIATRMDHDFATVTSWGEVCPSLSEIILPHADSLKWLRIIDNRWLPDPSDPQGSRWLWRMLYARKYPDWRRVLSVMEKTLWRADGLAGVIGEEEGAEDEGGEYWGTISGLRALSLRNAWLDGEGDGSEAHVHGPGDDGVWGVQWDDEGFASGSGEGSDDVDGDGGDGDGDAELE